MDSSKRPKVNVKPETLLMATIFGEKSIGPCDDDYHEIVGGKTLRETLLDVLDSIVMSPTAHFSPQFTAMIKPIIIARYGFDDGRTKTYQQLEKMFNVTRERIRQQETRALRMMRHPSRIRYLKPFLK